MPSLDNYSPAQTKVLHRRRSGYSSRTSSFINNRTHSLSTVNNYVQQNTFPRLPAEVIDRIVLLAIGHTRSFDSIASFSLASSDFRQIAFRRFFWTLRVESTARWSSLFAFLDEVNTSGLYTLEKGYLWVR